MSDLWCEREKRKIDEKLVKALVSEYNRNLKAYAWDDEQEGITTIVWAESTGKAKAQIANDYDIAFTEVKVYRLPWADEYADAERIPPEVYFKNGWSQWCHRCGNEVSEDEAVIVGNAVYHKWCYERMCK